MKITQSDSEFFKLVTAGWESLIVINELSECLDKPQNQTIHDFYQQVADVHFHKHQRDPFNPCTVLMASYLSLVLGKEKWEDILPDVTAKQSPEEWIICNCDFNDSCCENPSLKHVIRRMRNGIAHGRIEYDIPPQVKNMPKYDSLKETIFTIRDETLNHTRPFYINISALELWNLSVFFFNKIGNYEKNHLNSASIE